MSISIEELASRLDAEAERRGISSETLLDEFAARLDDPLEAFIGCGASGRTEPFDIYQERADAANKKLALRSTECHHVPSGSRRLIG